MKKTLLILTGLLLFLSVYAQDEIILRNGDIIQAKVSAVKPGHVEYYKWDMQEGPVYSLKKYEIFKITYANGRSELYSSYTKPKPVTSPGISPYEKKAKKEIIIENEGFTSINTFKFGVQHLPDFGGYSNGGTGPGFAINTVNGFQYKPRIFAGVGSGLNIRDFGQYGLEVPLFYNMRFDLSDKHFRSYISPSLGAAFQIPTVVWQDFMVAPLAGLEFGWKYFFNEKTALVFGLDVEFRYYFNAGLSYLVGPVVGISF